MKKTVSLVLSLICLILLAGCGNKEIGSFTAVIDSFYNNRISVYTVDTSVKFSAADVTFTPGTFIPKTNGIVKITYSSAKPNDESNAYKVTATQVEYIENAQYKTMSKLDFEKLDKSDILILDLRSTDQYKLGHLENAISLPANKINSNMLQKSKFKDLNKTIICYDLNGSTTKNSCLFLLSLGYKNVFDLGGIYQKDYTIVV